MDSEQKYLNKVILVTGTSRGVGKSLKNYFLANGAIVVGLSRSAEESDNPRYLQLKADISDEKQVRSACGNILKKFGRLDVLVNNASVLTSQYSMIMPSDDARKMIETNLLGTFLISREAAKLMKKNSFGRIINISSMAVRLEPMGDSVYAATKAAVITLTNVLAREFSSFNITCNSLGITAIKTDMLKQLPEDKIDAIVGKLTVPRYASMSDIENVVDFFASEKSSYITAQTIYLGGIN